MEHPVIPDMAQEYIQALEDARAQYVADRERERASGRGRGRGRGRGGRRATARRRVATEATSLVAVGGAAINLSPPAVAVPATTAGGIANANAAMVAVAVASQQLNGGFNAAMAAQQVRDQSSARGYCRRLLRPKSSVTSSARDVFVPFQQLQQQQQTEQINVVGANEEIGAGDNDSDDGGYVIDEENG